MLKLLMKAPVANLGRLNVSLYIRSSDPIYISTNCLSFCFLIVPGTPFVEISKSEKTFYKRLIYLRVYFPVNNISQDKNRMYRRNIIIAK